MSGDKLILGLLAGGKPSDKSSKDERSGTDARQAAAKAVLAAIEAKDATALSEALELHAECTMDYDKAE